MQRSRRRGIRLTPQQVAQLGKRHDKELAKTWGISPDTVSRCRKELGIPAVDTRFAWKPPQVRLLGKDADKEVARQAGVSTSTARKWRRWHGRDPHYEALNPGMEWTDEMLAQLGTAPDAVLAKRFGVHASTIRQTRHAHHIPNHRQRRIPYQPPPELLALLGRRFDHELAAEFGIRPKLVQKLRHARNIPRLPSTQSVDWDDPTVRALLGSRPDPEVAAELAMNRLTIMRKRREFGIAPYRPATQLDELYQRLGSFRDSEGAWRLSAAAVKRLSKHGDRELAAELAVPEQLLGTLRRAQGLQRGPRRRACDWESPAIRNLLARHSNKEAAVLIGVDPNTVRAHRNRLRIPLPE